MKSFFAASVLALVGSSVAAPSTMRWAKRDSPNGCGADPGPQGVINAINQWDSDVQTVNAFLDAAPGLDATGILSQIENVLNHAQDEPNQLQVLACEQLVGSVPEAQNAANDLFANFGNNVLVPLGNILANPGDSDSVNSNLDIINNFRCCHVLPDLDALWEETADDEGVSNLVPISAPRPNVCSSIGC